MQDLNTRLATVQDAELVDTMVREIALHEDSLSAVVADAADWRWMLQRPEVAVLLAFACDHPVGYASTTRRLSLWLGGDVLALDDLWVRPSARDQGVGRVLMSAVAHLAAEESLTAVWGARADNTGAHRFYERLGARLNTKVVASWAPEQYAWAVGA